MTVRTICRARIDPGELEDGLLHVVIFGPGHGEAVALKLPDGRWGIMDGCGERDRGGNPVWEVLVSAGVERLLFAALSHPHEDHLLGLDEILEQFHPEHVWWAGEAHKRMFRGYVRALKERTPEERHVRIEAHEISPATRVERLTCGLLARVRTREVKRRALGCALSDEKLLLRAPMPGGAPVEIRGVLPTTRSVQRGLKRAGASREAGLDLEPSEPDGDINEQSGALLLSWGDARVLLAGDALRGDRRGRSQGWAWWRDRAPTDPIQVVKVAHHASEGAHDDALWARMRPTLALVTPYRQARGTMPPRPEMLRALLSSGSQVGLTSRPLWWDEGGHALSGFSSIPPISLTGVPGRSPSASAAAPDRAGAICATLNSRGELSQIILAGGAALLTLASGREAD